MYHHSHVQWETLNSKQSNREKEIINKSLIVSYFLIFTLVFMALFMINSIFFQYNAEEAVSYSNYTGSVHIGVDTTAGDYYLKSNADSLENYIYGVRSNERDDFTRMAFADNQIIQVENGQHLILYQTDLVPVDKVTHETITSKLDHEIDKSIDETNTLEIDGSEVTTTEDSVGMVKLSNEYYNMPYVVSPNGEFPYVELYDDNLNVSAIKQIESDTLLVIEPTEASYVKVNDVSVQELSSFKTSGRLSADGFTPAVYEIGKSLEVADFIINPTSELCEYRVIDKVEDINATPTISCDDESEMNILELEEGQILELHNGTLNKYEAPAENVE